MERNMNGYQVKAEMLLNAIKAIHLTMTDEAFVASYEQDYDYSAKETESALMGICTELTYPLWVELIAVQQQIDKRL